MNSNLPTCFLLAINRTIKEIIWNNQTTDCEDIKPAKVCYNNSHS